MHHLKQENVKGVITFSTGNHGISIASSAQRYSIDATIVVPQNSNRVKIQSMREAGAKVLEEGKTFEEAREKIYKNILKINFENMEYRKDIAKI